MIKINAILALDVRTRDNWLLLQQELLKIKPIKKNHKNIEEDIDFRLLERLLIELRKKDLAISFIMSDEYKYEAVLLGIGRWRLPDEDGEKLLYKVIGSMVCNSIYECVAKSTLALYIYYQNNKQDNKK